MKKIKVISNTCVASEMYLRAKKSYTTPFVGSIFLDDSMYMRFLERYDHYINLEPKFDIVNQSVFLPGLKNIYSKYPRMKLEDVDIHWIHENNPETVLNKWNRRCNRGKGLEYVFTWSASEFMSAKEGNERSELIERFCNLPCFCIFLTERAAEAKTGKDFEIRFLNEFKDKKQNDRHAWHFLTWNNQYAIAMNIENVLKEKNMEI